MVLIRQLSVLAPENNQKKSGAEVAAIKKRVDTVSNPRLFTHSLRGATPLAETANVTSLTLYKPEEISAPSVARNSGSFNNGKTLQRAYTKMRPPCRTGTRSKPASAEREGWQKQYQAVQL